MDKGSARTAIPVRMVAKDVRFSAKRSCTSLTSIEPICLVSSFKAYLLDGYSKFGKISSNEGFLFRCIYHGNKKDKSYFTYAPGKKLLPGLKSKNYVSKAEDPLLGSKKKRIISWPYNFQF
jgi:hypothetical protein